MELIMMNVICNGVAHTGLILGGMPTGHRGSVRLRLTAPLPIPLSALTGFLRLTAPHPIYLSALRASWLHLTTPHPTKESPIGATRA